jgi:FliI/YscN family ATPase
MAEFVPLAAWLRARQHVSEPVSEPPIVTDVPGPVFVEACAEEPRLRLVRAMLDDAYEFLRASGVLDTQLRDGEAVVGPALLGRAIDARGAPLDGQPPPLGTPIRIDGAAPLPFQRLAITQPLWTGVRCIDGLLTIGRGARIGIFGAPGAGKSTLLETIFLGTRADAVIVGLVGERGREAQRWIASCDERTTVICATSDRSAQERVRAADLIMAHANALASRGLHVLVVLDSLARYAYALREVAVASGESAGRGGYPPSVFARMAQLVERAGAFANGSITMLATVLNDGEDHDPVSECARSLLDGHLQLSPHLAQAGRYPAIDVLASSSRTMDAVAGSDHLRHAAAIRSALARLDRCADARSLGIEPADAPTRAAIDAEEALETLLRQGREPVSHPCALEAVRQSADMLGEAHGYYV